jgi:hypothetical protein
MSPTLMQPWYRCCVARITAEGHRN